jgi:hypothetical protein
VALNSGNPINGSTFAIVNGSPITVPWSFTDKSHNTGPAAGEFLEEGINLTALGLQGCFSSFLAETRSSQSPTATLSDFVLGNFNTCTAELPNTATVQADGIAPITSNQVIITINDGHPLEATSVGSGAVADGLTAEQLQPIVAQAIGQWRAAGIDPATLSNLANVRVRLGDLPGAELGFAAGGTIWIDRTAAGWGWSVNGGAGRMDLTTVVAHELGHVLGFAHDSTGVMEARLAPGVRLIPEALPGTGTVTVGAGVSAGPTASGARAGELGVGPLAATSPAQGIDVGFAPAVPGGVTRALTAAQDGGGSQRSVTAVLGDRAQQAPLMIATPILALVFGGPDEGPGTVLVPGFRPPAVRVDSVGGDGVLPGEEAGDTEQAALPPSAGNTAGAPRDRRAQAQAGVRFREVACDACFADGSWAPDLAGMDLPLPGVEAYSSGQTPAAATAVAALAFALGGFGVAPRAETEPRRRRPSLI